jgi:hypothetical protein
VPTCRASSIVGFHDIVKLHGTPTTSQPWSSPRPRRVRGTGCYPLGTLCLGTARARSQARAMNARAALARHAAGCAVGVRRIGFVEETGNLRRQRSVHTRRDGCADRRMGWKDAQWHRHGTRAQRCPSTGAFGKGRVQRVRVSTAYVCMRRVVLLRVYQVTKPLLVNDLSLERLCLHQRRARRRVQPPPIVHMLLLRLVR